MHLAAQTEEAAEAHDQRTPANRVDMRPRRVTHQQGFVNVQLHDVYLEHVGAHVLAEGAVIVHHALHLHKQALNLRLLAQAGKL